MLSYTSPFFSVLCLRTDEVCAAVPAQLRQRQTAVPARLDAPQQPCHIPGQIFHGLQPLGVLQNFLGGISMDHIPVAGGDHRHIANGEIFVHYINGGGSSCPACRSHRSPRFEGKGFLQRKAPGPEWTGPVRWDGHSKRGYQRQNHPPDGLFQ